MNERPSSAGQSDDRKAEQGVSSPLKGSEREDSDLEMVVSDKKKEPFKVQTTDSDQSETLAELPADQTAKYASLEQSPPEDDVSNFFAVDSKTDDLGEELLLSNFDTETIDFKSDSAVIDCSGIGSKEMFLEEYEEDSNASENDDEMNEGSEQEIEMEEEQKLESESHEKSADDDDSLSESKSSNRMHVMENVEEGCDVSDGQPSSPGHAEERCDQSKTVSSAVQKIVPESPPKEEAASSPVQNGISSDNQPEKCSPKSEDSGEDDAASKDEAKPKKIDEESASSEPEAKEETESLGKAEDSASNDSSVASSKPIKRRSSKDKEITAKKFRTRLQNSYPSHDKIVNEYIDGCCSSGSLEELQTQAEQLLAEIRTLNELAREKEREWNNIIHLKKVKEEVLLRMQRKKQILLLDSDKMDYEDWENLDGEEKLKHVGEALHHSQSMLKANVAPANNGLMMVPIVSSSPSLTGVNKVNNVKISDFGTREKTTSSRNRTILPKPSSADLNGQSLECRQGRQGAILDVRSIIADYRQRHPETVPRRGRRLRSVLNNAQGAGVLSRQGHLSTDSGADLGLLLSTFERSRLENSRPSSSDSSCAQSSNDASFKDILAQFARLTETERQEFASQAAALSQSAAKPPPPYPEVTLHPVPATANSQSPSSSLLHGILTKSQPKTDPKPTTFSPTLARLLTAPERSSTCATVVNPTLYSTANPGVSIRDLLSGANKEEDEAEDSADRLVIDESDADIRGRNEGSDGGEDVPQCQGCHQRAAQFVCAGCGNQWYCSRDCQVTAWDEHSEVCSG